MKTRKIFHLLIVCMSIFSLFSCGSKKALPTVSELDLQRYAGTWYEIARLPNSFEKGLKCITATYTLKENGKVQVLNQGHQMDNPAKVDQAKGRAWVPDPEQPAQLKVSFFGPFAGDYYVIHLDENYQYALVGAPSRKYLWVLSRSSTIEDERYKSLLKIAEEQGFPVSQMIKVEHDCE